MLTTCGRAILSMGRLHSAPPRWRALPASLLARLLASMATMGILTGVLRVLSDFGDAAGWLIAALVLFAYGRRIIAENEKAHQEITKNVQDLDTKIDTVAKDLDTKIDTVAKDLDTKIDTVAQGSRHEDRHRRQGSRRADQHRRRADQHRCADPGCCRQGRVVPRRPAGRTRPGDRGVGLGCSEGSRQPPFPATAHGFEARHAPKLPPERLPLTISAMLG